jgi:hypothetical protein
MEDFEDEIKIALTRIKRSELKAMLQEHEEASFDTETKAAFNRIERDRLKKKLIEHAEGSGGGIPQVPSIGSKSPFNNYWKFAAAACVVLFSGLFFYNSFKSGNNAELAKTKIEKINEEIELNKRLTAAKIRNIETIANAKTESIVNDIAAIDPNHFGFTSSKLYKLNLVPLQSKISKLSTFVDSSNEASILVTNKIDSLKAFDLKYSLQNSTITIYSINKIEPEIYIIDSKSFLKIRKNIYTLTETRRLKRLELVTDSNIINQIP